MSGYLGARTQIADTGAYNREQADDLFPSKESVVAFSSTGTNTTMVKPPVYGIRVLEFTGATGTVTLPDMSAQPGGGRFRILKNNATQGSVNINLSGTNTGIWGSVQLKLNADGDFWELQWTGSRFVLTDGHETGADGNGDYHRTVGKQQCTIKNLVLIAQNLEWNANWEYPAPFADTPSVSSPVLPSNGAEWADSGERSNVSFTGYALSTNSTSAEARVWSSTGSASGDISSVIVTATGTWYAAS